MLSDVANSDEASVAEELWERLNECTFIGTVPMEKD